MTHASSTLPATTVRYVALDPADSARYRESLRDDFGNVLERRRFGPADVAPCRSCLELMGPGDDALLLAHRPFTTRGPYAEIGPIFIHADGCEPHDGGFPEAFLARSLTLRAYDRAGEIASATVTEPGAAEAWIARALAEPGVAVVHVRNPSYGCFDFLAVRDAGRAS